MQLSCQLFDRRLYEWERAAFERHLRTCVTCREELSELQEAWQALPFEMEEVGVPADLKQQVMQSIAPTKLKAIKRKRRRNVRSNGCMAELLPLS